MRHKSDKSKLGSALFFGGLFIIIGLVILLKTTGVLDLSLGGGFSTYWPIGLILVGIALLLKARWVAFSLLFLTLLFGALLLMDGNANHFGTDNDIRETVQEVTLDDDVQSVKLDLNYGAGEISIGKGNSSLLIRNQVETTDVDDPKITNTKEGTVAEVGISRSSSIPGFNPWQKSVWDMELSDSVSYDLDLDYGAAEVLLDLTGLEVDTIDMDFGASETEIVFADYPTKVDIDAGAASIEMKFPEGASVRFDINGGAVSKDLDGFVKKGRTIYESPGYNPDEPTIEIEINAGASSITGEFY
ncbi:toast rack family protein [Nanoarchaeota archaeon]